MDELADYDYELPPELIATEPLTQRDASRMLLVDRRRVTVEHRTIRDLPQVLKPGDCLVMNDTQVVPARLLGFRSATGGKWEGLFLRSLSSGDWRLIGHSGGKPQPGESITVTPIHRPDSSETLTLTLRDCDAEGVWTARPSIDGPAADVLRRFGTVPLPPYVRRKIGSNLDWDRYQTIFARHPGAVAAPTAGLHFTPELLAACKERGIEREFVTLHVGIGTFRPISVNRLSDHAMHSEWCDLSADTADHLRRVRERGGRIVAIGTTCVRTLETAFHDEQFHAHSGETNLFIRPPHRFRAVDCLLTNFHLPRSTLFVLVSAFAGSDLARQAYDAAIRERYRFYSYGDAMLIL
jgi:S-adenosylmethionine:tRNA ribosyltransferase-isomerase